MLPPRPAGAVEYIWLFTALFRHPSSLSPAPASQARGGASGPLLAQLGGAAITLTPPSLACQPRGPLCQSVRRSSFS